MHSCLRNGPHGLQKLFPGFPFLLSSSLSKFWRSQMLPDTYPECKKAKEKKKKKQAKKNKQDVKESLYTSLLILKFGLTP